MKTTERNIIHGIETKTDKYVETYGSDKYELHITTIYHSIGGTSKTYKMFINGNRDMSFPKRRISKDIKKMFGVL